MLAAVVLGLVGCGGASSRRDAVVVKVGDRAITKQELAGSMAAIAPAHVVPDPPRFDACVAGKDPAARESLEVRLREECARQYGSLKTRALAFLIRCEWLVAEAARRGLGVPSGATLTARAEAAASLLRRRLHAAPSRRVTPGEAASYYRLHRQGFQRPERRYFLIAEGLTRAEASRFLEGARHGARETGASAFFAEEFPRSSIAAAEGEYKVLREAIFAAPPHVLSGPETLNGAYTLFEVTRVTPARPRPLVEVLPAIERSLETRRRRQLPAELLAALRGEWRAKTDCQPGYVVRQCRQHAGGPEPEEEAFEFQR